MSLPTYDEVSRSIGHSYCRGIRPNGQTCYENHEGAIIDGDIHWGDRRATRSGLRKFLHLHAMAIVNRVHDTEPGWYRYWRAQKLVQTWSELLGIRFPASITDEYRAILRAMVVGAGYSPTEGEREEALRWSTIRKTGSA